MVVSLPVLFYNNAKKELKGTCHSRVQGQASNGDVLSEYGECEKNSLSASRLLIITNCSI